LNTGGCSIYAIRFQHGFLSRGGRRRNSPPGNARAEGFISFHLIKVSDNVRPPLIKRFSHGPLQSRRITTKITKAHDNQ
jgi:hypothetical protein